MADIARVTVTLPAQVIREIDRVEENRSKFILEAVRRELMRRRREELRRSIRHPHREGVRLAETGLDDWAAGLPEEDVGEMIDMVAGTPVRWTPGKGWTEAKR